MAYESKGEDAALKQGGFGGAEEPQQTSPYTNFQSEKDYVKEGYGGEGFQPATEPKEEQPDYYSTRAPPPAAHEDQPKPKPGVKETVKEKLGVGGEHGEGEPPKKGVVEKVKEKISPHSS